MSKFSGHSEYLMLTIQSRSRLKSSEIRSDKCGKYLRAPERQNKSLGSVSRRDMQFNKNTSLSTSLGGDSSGEQMQGEQDVGGVTQ